jgi:hypothetical protein
LIDITPLFNEPVGAAELVYAMVFAIIITINTTPSNIGFL